MQFIEIIKTLRVALIKDKEKKHLVENIHWIRDLKVLFPGKENIFDWFPKYFQRELRDKLEGQCHIKFTGDGQKRQLVISRDSEIQKNHFCAFKNLFFTNSYIIFKKDHDFHCSNRELAW